MTSGKRRTGLARNLLVAGTEPAAFPVAVVPAAARQTDIGNKPLLAEVTRAGQRLADYRAARGRK